MFKLKDKLAFCFWPSNTSNASLVSFKGVSGVNQELQRHVFLLEGDETEWSHRSFQSARCSATKVEMKRSLSSDCVLSWWRTPFLLLGAMVTIADGKWGQNVSGRWVGTTMRLRWPLKHLLWPSRRQLNSSNVFFHIDFSPPSFVRHVLALKKFPHQSKIRVFEYCWNGCGDFFKIFTEAVYQQVTEPSR